MNKSESIAKLATALNLAQAEMSGAKKKSSNPFFKSRYSDLAEVIHCIKEPFANNGLSYMQFPVASEGYAGVETIILHNSGEHISSEFTMKVSKNDPQGYGSAITYARRYGLQSAVGVPSEDDDGNYASSPSKNKSPAKPVKKELTNTQKLVAFHNELVGLKIWEYVSKEEIDAIKANPTPKLMDDLRQKAMDRAQEMMNETGEKNA